MLMLEACQSVTTPETLDSVLFLNIRSTMPRLLTCVVVLECAVSAWCIVSLLR